MNTDHKEYLRKLNNNINKFSGKFMSDTKWLKVFKKLSEHKNLISKCPIKSIGDDYIREIHIPSIENFARTFNKKGVNDITPGGPFYFKAIEWVEFPKLGKQDIAAIKNILEQIGQFETLLNDEKLIIYGYK